MKKDVIDIIMEKEFIELTQQELHELKEFCSSEEEFNQMKNVFIGVETMSVQPVEPKAETKESLDELFAQTYPKAAPVWYNSVLAVVIPKNKPIYRQPLMQIAAVALLLILVVPLFDNSLTSSNDELLADNMTPTEMQDDEAGVSENTNEASDVAGNSDEDVVENELESPEGDQNRQEPVVHSPDPTPQDLFSSPGGVGTSTAAAGVSDHPDGIFMGSDSNEAGVAYSQPASESEDLLDLLTVTF